MGKRDGGQPTVFFSSLTLVFPQTCLDPTQIWTGAVARGRYPHVLSQAMICFSTTTELQCWDVVEKLLKLKISLTHQEFCEYVNSDFIGLWKNLQDDISNTFPSSWTTSCMARFWSGELSISLNEKTKNKQKNHKAFQILWKENR